MAELCGVGQHRQGEARQRHRHRPKQDAAMPAEVFEGITYHGAARLLVAPIAASKAAI